ncbi:hypothetical protein PPERSA_01361 [Pseudocohnilembus persalinus]|uniref:Uncharacterized protein n=1 Tax=Pseudocohnilembus persalinus TaxID=266149 RepID=A0A0V0QGW6_PSEPJ|nr:hypothetical protein PPERSA_01361 [Pseudocohnilembus persalinus]|eukprot:KRX01458.1 hypothetical protein PPERSA_01361 [Pseudocohnilembus persalinus]
MIQSNIDSIDDRFDNSLENEMDYFFSEPDSEIEKKCAEQIPNLQIQQQDELVIKEKNEQTQSNLEDLQISRIDNNNEESQNEFLEGDENILLTNYEQNISLGNNIGNLVNLNQNTQNLPIQSQNSTPINYLYKDNSMDQFSPANQIMSEKSILITL